MDLQRLCPIDSGHTPTATPFSAQIGEGWWHCATNGHALLAVAGDDSLRQNGPSLKAVLDSAPRLWWRTPFADLLAWLQEGGDFLQQCATCKGGTVKKFTCRECHGDGETECPHCGKYGECEECEGAGTFDECDECGGKFLAPAKPETVDLGGAQFNRRLMFHYLREVSADRALVGFERDSAIRIEDEAGTWRCFVMPMRSGMPVSSYPGTLEPLPFNP